MNVTAIKGTLKEGDKVFLDAGFTCMKSGYYTVKEDEHGLFVPCRAGNHYLVGQLKTVEIYSGVYKSIDTARKEPQP